MSWKGACAIMVAVTTVGCSDPTEPSIGCVDKVVAHIGHAFHSAGGSTSAQRSVVAVPFIAVTISGDAVAGNDAQGAQLWTAGSTRPIPGAGIVEEMSNNYVLGNTSSNAVLVDPNGTVTPIVSDAGPTIGRGMNANALVVGAVGGKAFVWTACDGVTQLATPEGATSEASDINLGGDVVGTVRITTAAGPRARAAVWRTADGTRIDLPFLHAGDEDISAQAINDAGVVVGFSGHAPRGAGDRARGRGFVWQPDGTMREIGTFGGDYSAARDINNRGEVIGQATDAFGNSLAFIWRPETGLERLDTRGERTSFAYAINESGDVVGLVGGRPVVWVAPGNESRWPGAQ